MCNIVDEKARPRATMTRRAVSRPSASTQPCRTDLRSGRPSDRHAFVSDGDGRGHLMRATWYERQGRADEVLTIGTMSDPVPGPGEVRIRVAASGVNPGDVKKRRDEFSYGMPFPRVIPHSDGAGVIDRAGAGVAPARLGQRVWCLGAQTYRPYGTAAEYCVVPSVQAVPLLDVVSFEQGACLGIRGITAHRAVHAGGALAGRSVLVQGAAGTVTGSRDGSERLQGTGSGGGGHRLLGTPETPRGRQTTAPVRWLSMRRPAAASPLSRTRRRSA